MARVYSPIGSSSTALPPSYALTLLQAAQWEAAASLSFAYLDHLQGPVIGDYLARA